MFQIGETFTRLQPAIEFADSAFTPQEGTVSVLGDPPAKFAEVHSPSFLNAWYNKLHDCLERPVRTEQRGGHLAAQAAANEDQATLDLMEDRTQDIFKWASTEFEKQSAGYARRATLRGILRKIDTHNQHEEMLRKGKSRGTCSTRSRSREEMCRQSFWTARWQFGRKGETCATVQTTTSSVVDGETW